MSQIKRGLQDDHNPERRSKYATDPLARRHRNKLEDARLGMPIDLKTSVE